MAKKYTEDETKNLKKMLTKQIFQSRSGGWTIKTRFDMMTKKTVILGSDIEKIEPQKKFRVEDCRGAKIEYLREGPKQAFLLPLRIEARDEKFFIRFSNQTRIKSDLEIQKDKKRRIELRKKIFRR